MDPESIALGFGGALVGVAVTWGALGNRVATLEKEMDRARKSLHDLRDDIADRLTALEIKNESRQRK